MSYAHVQTPRAPQWQPSPFLCVSAALHAAAVAGAAVGPELWTWAMGAVAANHGAILAGGMLPRTRILGPNRTRLPAAAASRREVALTFDDGPDPEVTPRVLDLLDRAGVRATFFCIGERAARQPQLVRTIVEAGHTVENHSLRHRYDFSLFGPRRYLEDIGAAQEALAALAGTTPRFFRAPAGLRNPFLDYALTHLELELVSWTRRGFDTICTNAMDVHDRLTRNLRAGDILVLHDGHGARTPAGTPVVLEVLPQLLAALSAADLVPVTLRTALA